MAFFTNVVEYINSLKSTSANHIEVEFKLLIDKRINMPHFISPLADIKTSTIGIIKNALRGGAVFSGISQTINFIKTQENMFVKQLVYVDGVQDKDKKIYYSKKSLIHPIYFVSPENTVLSDRGSNHSLKLSINVETILDADINEFDIIRFRLRYSLTFADWKIDLTFIKETRDNSIAILKVIRDKLFGKTIRLEELVNSNDLNTQPDGSFDWEYPDRVEIELEYIGELSDFSIATVITAKQLIHNTHNISEKPLKTYKECICEIAQLIRPVQIDKFYNGNYGLKQLGANPVELNKRLYLNDVVPHINNYIVTEKIDGVRSMLILNLAEKMCYVINNKTDSGLIISKITTDRINDIDIIIIDAESIETSNISDKRTQYYIFDVLKFHNINVHEMPFSERYKYLLKVIELAEDILIDGHQFIFRKHFIELNSGEYGRQLHEFYEMAVALPYKIDGLIFISKNDNYIKTANYKWKPLTTIDFVAKLCPAGLLGVLPYAVKPDKTLYLLFSGMRRDEYRPLGIERLKLFDQMFKGVCVNKYGRTTDDYLPVQFAPSSNPIAYLYWSDMPDLDSKVIELYYDTVIDDWQLLNIRHDRQADLARKTYYGNYFKYAEQIWMNYQNSLTMDILCGVVGPANSYFKEDSIEYIAARKFNNYVKKQLIELNSKQTDLSWVVCLAAGKGQDLFKYTDCGFENILCIDIDYDAISEIINRKYIYINNTSKNPTTHDKSDKKYSKIFVKCLDLSDTYKHSIDAIYNSSYGIPSAGVPLVVCNLALHYIVSNKTKAQNFANMLNKLLAVGGIFIFTAFSGEKVFDALRCNEGTWNRFDSAGKLIYSIKKKYNGDAFTGTNQKIDVLLPFSGGNYYTENLINIQVLNDVMAKKKINLIASDSFGIYLDKFAIDVPAHYSKLSDIDREYCSFYHFYVYHKQGRK